MALLTSTQSVLLASIFAFSYVGSIYVQRESRLSFAPVPKLNQSGVRVKAEGERWRDDDSVIRARLTAVVASTLLSCACIAGIVVLVPQRSNQNIPSFAAVFNLLGLTMPTPSFLPYAAVPILYTGPLYTRFLSGRLPYQRNSLLKSDILHLFNTWQGLRNFIVAPLTEELVFRSCIVAALRLSGQPTSSVIFLSPLWFGVAHLHHAWELIDQNGRTAGAIRFATLICFVQLTYTTVFGWFAAFLLVQSGSFLPSFSSHVFCNILGLPSPSFDCKQHPQRALAIWTTHFLGVIGFVYCLRCLSVNQYHYYR